ncbi:hypothetical protein PVAP13_8KG148200 [Panicum virgatum]|uniref:Uncharacterized protein n=1 Tax=Panicum virgatum TaxID=38727 RepID=A0A8T0PSZ6_PANVG|nr:hypothetical protein PVAP13_8KG148200 [Panicum virgatum]
MPAPEPRRFVSSACIRTHTPGAGGRRGLLWSSSPPPTSAWRRREIPHPGSALSSPSPPPRPPPPPQETRDPPKVCRRAACRPLRRSPFWALWGLDYGHPTVSFLILAMAYYLSY